MCSLGSVAITLFVHRCSGRMFSCVSTSACGFAHLSCLWFVALSAACDPFPIFLSCLRTDLRSSNPPPQSAAHSSSCDESLPCCHLSTTLFIAFFPTCGPTVSRAFCLVP
ncbi:hypothetical protein O6H91_18G081300 [Diphasiastrum complanatum]|uniref:Uncharacterized protein n=1 Tax=Diphasiastrum complanatum TaxID=34168 RepID=A0ACC2B357_DIPCM|nr:hypothetical protein O6H91_18G081300 [Diphasiastrum complanatum]